MPQIKEHTGYISKAHLAQPTGMGPPPEAVHEQPWAYPAVAMKRGYTQDLDVGDGAYMPGYRGSATDGLADVVLTNHVDNIDQADWILKQSNPFAFDGTGEPLREGMETTVSVNPPPSPAMSANTGIDWVTIFLYLLAILVVGLAIEAYFARKANREPAVVVIMQSLPVL